MQPDLDEHGRPEPPTRAGEAATLTGFLDYQRATLEWKTRGLSDAQLRLGLHPTAMTLAGLLSHLAYVEDYWFGVVAGQRPPAEPWASADFRADRDYDWHLATTLGGDDLRQLWRGAVAASRGIVADLLDAGPDALDAAHPAWGGRDEASLRWVLVHMIEEYARHNGHADLLREAVDGGTGE